MYIFTWATGAQEIADSRVKLAMVERREAALLTGVGSCAAQPTGCIAIDMRLFALMEPDLEKGKGWFYYEYTDGRQAKKASTEDVTFSRDASMIVHRKLGYNPLLVAWDCWAGHVKPVTIGKPAITTIDYIENRYAQAVRDDVHNGERVPAEESTDPEGIT